MIEKVSPRGWSFVLRVPILFCLQGTGFRGKANSEEATNANPHCRRPPNSASWTQADVSERPYRHRSWRSYERRRSARARAQGRVGHGDIRFLHAGKERARSARRYEEGVS